MSWGSRRKGNRRRKFMRHLLQSFESQKDISYTVDNAFEIMGWPTMSREEALKLSKVYALGYLDNNNALGEALKASVVLGVESFFRGVDFVRKSADASHFRPQGRHSSVKPPPLPRRFSIIAA